MIEIRYSNQYEVADLSGRSVSEARKLFKNELDIPDKASARLNGKRVKGSLEADTLLTDCDTLSFAHPRGKAAYMVGALLMALVITGSVFAYGYTTASTTLSVTAAGADFAAISTANTGIPSWTPYGFFKGSTGSGNLFIVDTQTSNFSGDMTITVSIANGDVLVQAYRVLAMFIEMKDSDNVTVDINADGENDSKDYALLTLGNGAVDLYVEQEEPDVYDIKLKSGFYISNIWGASPRLGW